MCLAVLSLGVVNPAVAEGAKSAVGAVARLYQDYAWEAVIQEPDLGRLGLMQAPRSTLIRYFSPSLVALLMQDRECARRTQAICRLDFLPIWASQDPAATGLTVVSGGTPTSALVRFTHPGNQQPVELRYTLEQTPQGWRISDIASSDWSLREVLKPQK